MIHSPPRGQRCCQGNLSRKTFASAESCRKGENSLLLSHLGLFQKDRWGFFKHLGKWLPISWARVAILSAARHHKAAFRGNWLLVDVNACCHVLFTPLAGETLAPANRFHVLPLWQRGEGWAHSTVTSEAARKYLHILSFLSPRRHLPV